MGASVSPNNVCDFTLDLKNGLIVRAGKPFAVRHKIFETLAFWPEPESGRFQRRAGSGRLGRRSHQR